MHLNERKKELYLQYEIVKDRLDKREITGEYYDILMSCLLNEYIRNVGYDQILYDLTSVYESEHRRDEFIKSEE